ncbi:Gti1/Pac2 family-domain-containing protein [Obelidium mucronatum]|nr:Gti1/Pac2 family-domain-containing protein [Obelidium mucronatum]
MLTVSALLPQTATATQLHILDSPQRTPAPATLDLPSLLGSAIPPTEASVRAHGSELGSNQPTATATATAPSELALACKELTPFESWFGFVKDKRDAQLLVEACLAGVIRPLRVVPANASLRSGSVIVFMESSANTQLSRWRDGESWSPSRIHGSFLLYREVESTKGKKQVSSSDIPQAIERCRFATTSYRPNTRPVQHGFAKLTITIVGSDNCKYRVISCFYPHDVEHFYDDADIIPPPSPAHSAGYMRRKLKLGETLRTPSGSGFEKFATDLKIPSLLANNSELNSKSKKRTLDVPSDTNQSKSPCPSPLSKSVASPTPELTSPPAPQNCCNCGGLRNLSPWDYYSVSPEWTESIITLSPLKKIRL